MGTQASYVTPMALEVLRRGPATARIPGLVKARSMGRMNRRTCMGSGSACSLGARRRALPAQRVRRERLYRLVQALAADAAHAERGDRRGAHGDDLGVMNGAP